MSNPMTSREGNSPAQMGGPDIAKIGEGGVWFCDSAKYWGTLDQLTRCAKCGKSEIKRADEPRHYAIKPSLHMICDKCFDALPE